jgi:hypothetical protein
MTDIVDCLTLSTHVLQYMETEVQSQFRLNFMIHIYEHVS